MESGLRFKHLLWRCEQGKQPSKLETSLRHLFRKLEEVSFKKLVTGCKSDAFKAPDIKVSLARLKKDIKMTSFFGNCCVEKFLTLPVFLENKESAIGPYATQQ